MEDVLKVLIVGWVAAMISAWVLLRAVKGLAREKLDVKDIVRPTSMTLGAIWLVGWVVLSFKFATVLWAPLLLIPLTAPLAVVVVAALERPDERRKRSGEVEYSHSYTSFQCAGAEVIVVALIPQLFVAMKQVGLD